MVRTRSLLPLLSASLAAAQTSTYYLAAQEAYTVKNPDASVPTSGSDVTVLDSGEGGVDVYRAPDRAKAVADALNNNCGSITDPKCFQSVADANGFGLGKEDNGLSKRSTAMMRGGWLGAALGVVIDLMRWGNKFLDDRERMYYHLSTGEFSKIAEQPQASVYVFATASDDPSAITVPVTAVPTPDPTDVPSIKNDGTNVVVTVPEGHVSHIDTLIHHVVCKRAIANRDEPDVLKECIRLASESIMRETQTSGFLDQVMFVPDAPIPQDFDDVLDDLEEYAGGMNFFGPGDDGAGGGGTGKRVAKFSLLLSWMGLQQQIGIAPSMTVAASAVKSPSETGPTSTSSSQPCPTEPWIRPCGLCGGDKGGARCGGHGGPDGKRWEDCPCFNANNPVGYPDLQIPMHTAAPEQPEVPKGDPTSEPKCFPTAGPPHDNPDNDQLIHLCGFHTKDACLEQKTNMYCPGGGSSSSPLRNNHYNAFFKKADNAPADCNNVFNNDHDKNPLTDLGANLCFPALDAIIKACPWTGGEVQNVCGTYALQSCPLGRSCTWGNPIR